MSWWAVVLAYLALASLFIIIWSIMHYFYKRIYGVRVVWWARWMTHGSLLYVRRLPPKYERPLRKL